MVFTIQYEVTIEEPERVHETLDGAMPLTRDPFKTIRSSSTRVTREAIEP